MIEYNNRKVYDCFNNIFTFYGGNPDLNLPPMPIDDSHRLKKRSHYTSDPLTYYISVTSGNYISTFNTPYYYSQVIILNYDDTKTHHTIINGN